MPRARLPKHPKMMQMMQTVELFVLPQYAGQRLDKYVAQQSGLSRAAVQQLLAEGHVVVNGKRAAKSYPLAGGDAVAVTIPPPAGIDVTAQEIPLDIVYEDDSLAVVNKPKGMVVHPAAGNPDGTLVNALLYHCKGGLSGIGGKIRPGIVHRIDKDTSGLLVVAKDDDTHQKLSAQFAQHSINRVYHAVVYGQFKQEEGEVDVPLGRSRADRKKIAPAADGKPARTTYRVESRYVGFTHLSLRLFTGRTHQIRVHMASIGHPVAGDAVYGPKKVIHSLHGQCLHAKTLGFVHPKTGLYAQFDSALPTYFTTFTKTLLLT